jgi:hypothetical protein
LEDKNRPIAPAALARLLKKEKLALPLQVRELQAGLDQLYHKDILIKDDQSRYRFRIDLFRRWIARDHSIWEVIHQLGASGDQS